MATYAIYYTDYIPEEKQKYPQKSFSMTRGYDKSCNELLKKRGIEKCPEGKTLICRLYELEVSPHHLPILGFVDIFVDEKDIFYSRVTLNEGFEDNEGLYTDLETDANTQTLNVRHLAFCTKIS